MVKLLRRFAVLAALMFWQGGFTFFAAVVVPTGAAVLGSHLDQAFITQLVTNDLNIAGAAALPFLAWDVAASPDKVRWRRLVRWAIWGLLAVTLAAQVWLHFRLDALMDVAGHRVLDREAFRIQHQQYLMISTGQWIGGVACLAMGLWAWQAEDVLLARSTKG